MPDADAQPWLTTTTTPADTWRVVIDARSCMDEQAFFRTAKVELKFPDYFGFNWDAFSECFQDLHDIEDGGMGSRFGDRDGRPGNRLELVINHTEYLLVDEPITTLAILVRILRYAAHKMDTLGRAYADLYVTMSCATDAFSSVIERLRATGVGDNDLMPGG